MRESDSCALRAAGATQPTDSQTLTQMKMMMPTPTTRPSTGQRNVNSSVTPTATTSAGIKPNIKVSPKESKAHMPRVILRTVAPAKALACQSAEKRCTAAKPSYTTWRKA